MGNGLTENITRARAALGQARAQLKATEAAAKADGTVTASERRGIREAQTFVALKETNLSLQKAKRTAHEVRADAFDNGTVGPKERAAVEKADTRVERLRFERLELRGELGIKGGGTPLVVSSFNVTGSSHTGPGSTHPELESGPKRMRYVADLMKRHQVDVMGFQELQGNQLEAFKKLTNNRYGVYPGFQLGRRESVNSVAWDKKKWDLVKADTVDVPYFNGNKRPMPVVLLKNKQTGQKAYFVNVHNPADTRRFPNQGRHRDAAREIQIDLVNRLKKTGIPVILTGDMNERETYERPVTKRTGMTSSHEGPNGARSNRSGIDWIFGTKNVAFSDYHRDRSKLVRDTTNHPMIVTRARLRPSGSKS